eukprot:TRINITY_DN17678_c0_g1_i1.p1 TRINITY_DN17678_c0_g1~~TRINITY_DN17678_c0_g1_i1.p1  ORF type:complete len:484 (-),score=69.27 TRINITY_DN17678_c0_g1_i1:121-1572(-)
MRALHYILFLTIGLSLAFTFLYVRDSKPQSSSLSPPPLRPNIVFILANDLGQGEIEPFVKSNSSDRKIRTPALFKFAQESVTFMSAYVGGTQDVSSRCSFHSGSHTGHCSVRHPTQFQFLEKTFAGYLGNYSYDTGFFGKWNLQKNGPLNNGYNKFVGFISQEETLFFPEKIWYDHEYLDVHQPISIEKCGSSEDCKTADSIFTKEAVDFINKPREKPFLMVLSLVSPMSLRGDGPVGSYFDKSWPRFEKAHASMITDVLDKAVEKVMNAIRVSGKDPNTITIFSSVNGPYRDGKHSPMFFQSSASHKGVKSSLYEGGLRSPTMIRWMGKIAEGTSSNFPITHWDYFPTVAELAGVPKSLWPPNTDGISLVSFLLSRSKTSSHPHSNPNTDPDPLTRPPLFWEMCHKDESGLRFARASRIGKWKGISWFLRDGFTELYDVENDPTETTNLALVYPELAEWAHDVADENHRRHKNWPPHCRGAI